MTAAERPDASAEWGLFDVTVGHAGSLALDGVTLPARPREITAVVGGDGSGKTTCLRTLVGAIAPASGEVRRPDRRRIGYVSPGPGIYPDLTVDETLQFVGAAYGLGRAEVAERSSRLLELTDLADARGRLGGQLSGGMRQKLALAAAVIHVPALLVLDEPTTGVDPVSRADLWRLLAGIAARGTAIVVATTYLDEAERAATVVVLVDGRPLVGGQPADVIAAMPGAIGLTDRRLDPVRSWRRGRSWRTWVPDGRLPEGASPVAADLEDAVVVAQLADRDRARTAAPDAAAARA